MEKNEQYEITIEDLSNEGAGIGHIETEDGGLFAVFVKDAVPGDRCRVQLTKVKERFAYARLIELIEPGEDRVTPLCKNAARCGGCTMMQLSYEAQLRLKLKKVSNCLVRLGGLPAETLAEVLKPVCGMERPFYYRNKMQLPIGADKNGKVNVGFFAGRTHSIIDIDRCPIGHPVCDYIIRSVKQVLQALYDGDKRVVYNEELHEGLFRHMLIRVGFHTGEVMVCFVINGTLRDVGASTRRLLIAATLAAVDEYNAAKQLYEKMRDSVIANSETISGSGPEAETDPFTTDGAAPDMRLASVVLNYNTEKTNRIMGDRSDTVYGADAITDTIGDNAFEISPVSFYQVNPYQTERLYEKVAELAQLEQHETVWDLYCGIGTISLTLAKRAGHVYGVEIVPQAVEDAKRNAERNGIDNAEFFCGKAEDVVTEFYEKGAAGAHADCVVVDPPRKGCDQKLIETMLAMSPARIVYVSCDPATLARDLKLLTGGGYRVCHVQPYDQFCHSMHVENVVLLVKES